MWFSACFNSGAQVYIYIYIGCGPRVWRLQWEAEGVCMTEVSNDHMHLVSIDTFCAESLEGYKHPCVLKWANGMGYATQSRKNKVRVERTAK